MSRKGFGEEDSGLWNSGRPGRAAVWRMGQGEEGDSRLRRRDGRSKEIRSRCQSGLWLSKTMLITTRGSGGSRSLTHDTRWECWVGSLGRVLFTLMLVGT